MTNRLLRDRSIWAGLVLAVGLYAAAVMIPTWRGQDVYIKLPEDQRPDDVPPLVSAWEPRLALASLVCGVLAVLLVSWGPRLARALPWRGLLLGVPALAMAWMVALALVDGERGLTKVLTRDSEYLVPAREVDDVGVLLSTYVDKIPLEAKDNHPIHLAGHPPGALLVFVALFRLGLGGDLVAPLVIVALAATASAAVLVTVRAVDSEDTARRVAPFLVVMPAGLWMAVSADGMFAAVGAWGIAAMALAATAQRRGRRRAVGVTYAVLAGLLLGYCVMLSYGLPLLGLVGLAVLAATRCWWPFPIVAGSAAVVVLAFAAGGFVWWEALPVLRERYYDGIASDREASYWIWANLAVLAVSAGPMVWGALTHTATRARALWRGAYRPTLILVAGAVLMVTLADLSLMSKAEVERIWLPFVPWLTVATAFLPERWQRPGLAIQCGTALAVQHLLITAW